MEKTKFFFQSTHNGEKINKKNNKKNNKNKLKKNDFLMGLSSKGYDLIFFSFLGMALGINITN